MASYNSIRKFIENCADEGFVYLNMGIDSINNLFNKKLMPVYTEYLKEGFYLRKLNPNRPNETLQHLTYFINEYLYGIDNNQNQQYNNIEEAVYYGVEHHIQSNEVDIFNMFRSETGDNFYFFLHNFYRIKNNRSDSSPYYFGNFKLYYEICKYLKFNINKIKFDEYFFSTIDSYYRTVRSVALAIRRFNDEKYLHYFNTKFSSAIESSGFLCNNIPCITGGSISSINFLRKLENKIFDYINKSSYYREEYIDKLFRFISLKLFIIFDDKDSIESIIYKIEKKYINQLQKLIDHRKRINMRLDDSFDHYDYSRSIILSTWLESKISYLDKERTVLYNGAKYTYRMSSRIDEIKYEDLTDEPIEKFIKFGGFPNTKPEKVFENSRLRKEKEYSENIVYFKDLNLNDVHTKQILNSKDLIMEGKLMNHCVSGYVHNCSSGISYIFHCNIGSGSTFEIQKSDNIFTLIQNRCIHNSNPSDDNIKYVENFVKHINKKSNNR